MGPATLGVGRHYPPRNTTSRRTDQQPTRIKNQLKQSHRDYQTFQNKEYKDTTSVMLDFFFYANNKNHNDNASPRILLDKLLAGTISSL